MRVSLINPNLSGDVSILDIGLTYLATYLSERANHPTQIIDFTFHRKNWEKHLHKKIQEFKPDVVGITCTSLYLGYIKSIAKEIKKQYGLPIICGGYHASLNPEQMIQWEEMDAVCIGDGEYTMTEYIEALEKKKPFEGIKGLWVKSNGEVIENPLRERIADIDSLPVSNYDLWEDIDQYLYFNQLLYFMGCRGCPYNCTYCSEYPIKITIPGKHFRKRDPRKYAQEIKHQWEKYKNRNMHLAHTFDPVFTLDREWVKDFCDEYIKLGLSDKLPFSFFTRGDLIDEEKIQMAAKAGGKLARIGFESGNPHILQDIYEKKITNDQYKEAVRLCKKYGFAITGYYILGGPGEDKNTLNDTFNLAKELDVSRPVFFIYQPLPKTKSIEKLYQLGGKIDAKKFQHIDSLHHASAVSTKGLKPIDIQLFQYKCFLYFIVGRRFFRLLLKQKFKLILNFIKYFIHAKKHNIPLWYTVGYFIICCEENLIT